MLSCLWIDIGDQRSGCFLRSRSRRETQSSQRSPSTPSNLPLSVAPRTRYMCVPAPNPEHRLQPLQYCRQLGNYRKRVLHKLAKDLELPKLTFRVIRRTIATLAQKKGTVKDVQGVLRHSRTATTTDVYMQEISESVQAMVNSIHSELRGKPSLRIAKAWRADRRSQASLKSRERMAAKKVRRALRRQSRYRTLWRCFVARFWNLLPKAGIPGRGIPL